MAKTQFTTWKAILDDARTKLAQFVESGTFREASYTSPDGETYRFYSPKTLTAFIEYLEARVESEASNTPRHRPMAVRKTRFA